LPKECSYETTIDVGLVPHSSSPLSLHDVSGGSIRPVAHALILCAGVAEWAFGGFAVRRILEGSFSSPVQLRAIAGEDDPGQTTVGQIREKTR
jgi:hypothetical protein